jgi:hypothetical protein
VRLKTGGSSSGKKILIDGQQRVTALMAAIAGKEIVDDDYHTANIKIAFNPFAAGEEERFAVQSPAHINDRRWIPDISEVFKAEFKTFKFIKEYHDCNPQIDENDLGDILTQLKTIVNRQIGIIELAPTLQIDEVTEIFVRINSQGKALSQADFAMSKIAADEAKGGHILRKAIDYFCHLAVKPDFYSFLASHDKEFMESDYAPRLKWLRDDKEDIYDPDYSDMLRVSFMHKFSRGKIGDLVSLISGRDFSTREYKESIAVESFDLLKSGVLNFMNEFNFTNFVVAIKSAGFVSSRLINSQLTMDFAYTLYLMLSADSRIPKTQLKRLIQKWYLLSVLTGRYISSAETMMDSDMKSIVSKGFTAFSEETEKAVLSDNFWNIALVQALETSVTNSPYFISYLAAQSFMGDNSLFMKGTRVSTLITTLGDVHHIFPKKYLQNNGIKEKNRYNQIANLIYLDTQLNISIGDSAPNDYFSKLYKQCESKNIRYGNISDQDELTGNIKTNCIPEDVTSMDYTRYDEFLLLRRKMMAEKIHAFYIAL